MKISRQACLLTLCPLLSTGLARAQDTEEERGVRVYEDDACEGYTLFSPLKSTSAYLVDMDGQIVHGWETPYAPAGGFYLLDNGHLLRCGRVEDNPRFNGGGIGGIIQEYEWDENLVWEMELANEHQTQHHDVQPLPNGNVLVIVWEAHTGEEAIARGRDPEQVGEDGLWPDAILEIKPTPPMGGDVVWEWHAWDHLIQDFDESKGGFGSVADHPELVDINADHRDQPPLTQAEIERLAATEDKMRALGYIGGDEEEEEDEDQADESEGREPRPDWLHTNGINYDAVNDLIVISTPELCELWVIDHSTTSAEAASHSGGRYGRGGDILWRWGNPRNYGGGTASDEHLDYQHDPTFVHGNAPGELSLLVFNNGPRRGYSIIDELLLPFDSKTGFRAADGQALAPSEPAWSYSDEGNFFSSFISGAQRLSNGNTLICSGAPGRVFEVTRDGKIVWDFLNPFGGEVSDGGGGGPGGPGPKSLFRATRIAPDHPGLPEDL